MKRLITTLLILLIGSVYCYSQTDLPSPSPIMSPTGTPFSTATPFGTASPTPTPFAANTPTGSPSESLASRMRDLDKRMDTIFSDAFRNAGNWFNHSAMTSSISLREQKDKYIARVYLPHFDTSKAQVKVENGDLHIVANPENTGNGNTEAQKYEQTISLPEPVQSNNIQVQRKPDLLVITVPKETGGQPGVASSTASPSPGTSSESAANPYEWENSVANEFDRMNAAMDQALHQTFPDTFASGPHGSALDSAIKMDDQQDKYVVHFYLPKENVSNVRVNFDNGELHLRAKEGNSGTSQQPSGTSQPSGSSAKVTGEYTATISVPGPVNDNQMKVDRQANAVVVTLPKA